jgi:3-(3-hydroxy-phenyl)propionate hydroxylase
MSRHLSTDGTTRSGDFDVLIVGAGPTGLLAACELLRRGVRVRVVDRATEPAVVPKALSIWPRALDILADVGLLDAIQRESHLVTALSYFSRRRPLATFDFAEDLACRTLPQHVTERLLTERLHALGGAVERGVRLLTIDDQELVGASGSIAGAVVSLEHTGGEVERVLAPYLIGADGASSTVRGQLGVGFDGSTYEMAFALIDTHIEGPLPADECLFYQSPAGALVIVPMPDGVFRFLSVMPDGQGALSVPMMQAIVDERGPDGVRLTDSVSQAVFRVHARQVDDFRRGRVFLMGDAAHVHSPAGGQGMNNGMQDAHNLGWKLAAVVRGESPNELLDTYGPERAEATSRIVRDTDLQTRVWVAKHPAKVLARDVAFRLLEWSGAVSRWYAPVMAGRRLAYRTLRETQQPSGWAACRPRSRLPGGMRVGAVFPRQLAKRYGISGAHVDPSCWTVVAVRKAEAGSTADLDRLTARWPSTRVISLPRHVAAPVTGCGRTGYYLVRPDGHIVAHGHAGDLDRLSHELDNALVTSGEGSCASYSGYVGYRI